MAQERLQKIIAGAGLCSRRAAEEYIVQGRVTVNGETALLGMRADIDCDQVLVDGIPVTAPAQRTYIMLNKPRGYVTTMADEQGRPTVRELCIDCGARVYPVGRLDLNSEGLLLLTDDGQAAKRLTHPSHQIEKEYLAWVTGYTEQALEKLRRPMVLDGVILRPAKVHLVQGQTQGAHLLSITIHEGRNRQVRRMCQQADLYVVRLRRIAVGALKLGSLESGAWRSLTPEEIAYVTKIP